MDTQESSARTEAYEGRVQDHPHACMDGYIFLGYTAMDEESGEEIELIERIPCRRCVEEGNS